MARSFGPGVEFAASPYLQNSEKKMFSSSAWTRFGRKFARPVVQFSVNESGIRKLSGFFLKSFSMSPRNRTSRPILLQATLNEETRKTTIVEVGAARLQCQTLARCLVRLWNQWRSSQQRGERRGVPKDSVPSSHSIAATNSLVTVI